MAGDIHRFDKRRVGDAHEDRHAIFDLAADALDQFTAQAITQARPLAGRAQDEQSAHAAGQNALDEPFQSGDVQFVPVAAAA
jgi:hypothetical protein